MLCPKELTVRLSNKDKKYLKLATKIAELSECRFRHAAVIVSSGRVMSVGINKFKNHPDVMAEEDIKNFCHVHAEVDALNKLKRSAKGCTIYVARIGKGGESRFSRPCDNCYQKLSDAGIYKIVYTD